MGAAIGVAISGGVVLFVADHFVRPVIIGEGAKLPFLWVLLGILGGVESFGLVGIFLGPALMAVLVEAGTGGWIVLALAFVAAAGLATWLVPASRLAVDEEVSPSNATLYLYNKTGSLMRTQPFKSTTV